jgi:hypothetical protein
MHEAVRLELYKNYARICTEYIQNMYLQPKHGRCRSLRKLARASYISYNRSETSHFCLFALKRKWMVNFAWPAVVRRMLEAEKRHGHDIFLVTSGVDASARVEMAAGRPAFSSHLGQKQGERSTAHKGHSSRQVGWIWFTSRNRQTGPLSTTQTTPPFCPPDPLS